METSAGDESANPDELEPIPLGHRQTIRRYFELIRPASTDPVKDVPADKKDAPPEKKAPDKK